MARFALRNIFTVNILYSTHTSPDYMPPLVISERQIVVGPNYPHRIDAGRLRSIKIAPGRYDLAALVASLPAEQKPELTVVLIDAYQQCLPENLAAVPGRKLLLVADTHHGQFPLQKVLAYARREPFDRIVVTHDPHHLHWFAEAAIAPTRYVPNVNVSHFPQPFNTRRQANIVFVGQAGQFHPRRRHLLQAIRKAGLPLVVQQAPAPMAAFMYNSAQIAFNCSLNGDLNMRVFEVMAAGGFLVTDRLSPQSGLETLFRRGEDYADYDSPDDLIAKLRHYLAHPEECLKIARSGQSAYLKSHNPAQRVRDLLGFASGTSIAPTPGDPRALSGTDGFGRNLEERVRIYEVFQNFAQQSERIVVIADATLGARCIADLADLPRLKIQVAATAEQSSPIKASLGRLGVLDQIDFIEGEPGPCDVLAMDARTIASLKDSRNLRARFLTVMGAGSIVDDKTAWLAAHGFSKVGEKPRVFERGA